MKLETATKKQKTNTQTKKTWREKISRNLGVLKWLSSKKKKKNFRKVIYPDQKHFTACKENQIYFF
jgi:Mlc titration factor MtfA (ptsG expression regulator)